MYIKAEHVASLNSPYISKCHSNKFAPFGPTKGQTRKLYNYESHVLVALHTNIFWSRNFRRDVENIYFPYFPKFVQKFQRRCSNDNILLLFISFSKGSCIPSLIKPWARTSRGDVKIGIILYMI